MHAQRGCVPDVETHSQGVAQFACSRVPLHAVHLARLPSVTNTQGREAHYGERHPCFWLIATACVMGPVFPSYRLRGPGWGVRFTTVTPHPGGWLSIHAGLTLVLTGTRLLPPFSPESFAYVMCLSVCLVCPSAHRHGSRRWFPAKNPRMETHRGHSLFTARPEGKGDLKEGAHPGPPTGHRGQSCAPSRG